MTLDVHLIPHSHTDPGWLNTYAGYYGDVKNILTKVVAALGKDRNRTFVWAETCFFTRWFGEQSAAQRELVRQLVAARQLEFVGCQRMLL